MSSPAPIALFVYRRPEHTKRTLDALRNNALASQSELFVFSDGAKAGDERAVEHVREIVASTTGFARVSLVASDTNRGLASSIVNGIGTVLQSSDRVVVLEDDVVTGRGFLSFLNAALDRFANEPRVWSISGWNYPIPPEGLPEAFLWRGMNCWGWATWADRWRHFDKNPRRLVGSWTRDAIHRFNIDGAEPYYWRQVLENERGDLNTWAVFWYATIFEHDGLCLNPTRSLVQNIGFDGSGEHSGASTGGMPAPSDHVIMQFPDELTENARAVERIRAHYDGLRSPRWSSLRRRVQAGLSRFLR